MGGFAQFERELVNQRQREGIANHSRVAAARQSSPAFVRGKIRAAQ
jgi:DNA invertase Pin-like site-specific DNA recombinase